MRASNPKAPAEVEYACNCCGVTSWTDATLYRSRGRACPYCGEGVIQVIER